MLITLAGHLADDAGNSGGGSSLALTVFVALVAAIPGIGGLILSFRKRREQREATATEFGTQMAQSAFTNMEAQVSRLTEEQARWDLERNEWARDKADLLARISALSDQLQVTNLYLQLLLSTLDGHGIAHPTPPPGFHSLSTRRSDASQM